MTLIFDFDGTLADTFELLFDLANKYREKFGIREITQEDKVRFRSSPMREVIDELEIGLAKIPFILKFARQKMRENIAEVHPFPGIPETIKVLKEQNVTLGVVTSNSASNVKTFLENNGLLDCFTFINSESSLFGKDKALNRVIKKNKLKKENTLYIGDEVRDIIGAHKAGLKVIAVTWGYNAPNSLKENNPDFLINNPKELLSIVEAGKIA